MMEEFIIGVDSGGTSTVAEAYSLDGQLIGRSQTGFGNLLIDKEKALANLKEAVTSVLDPLDAKYCKGILLGIAGIDTGDYKQFVYNLFADLNVKKVIVNDAWLAHYALLEGEDGCLVISGTGSVAIGRYNGEEARVGGWGHLLGDEGSGYAISRRLIKDVLTAYDDNREWRPLEQKLFNQGLFQEPFEIARFVYQASKDQVADLSKFISQEADKQDEQAIAILEQAGEDLGRQVLQLFHKLGQPDVKRVAVTGSVLQKNTIVYKSFKDKILSEVESCQFVRKQISNTVGALYYFKKKGISKD